MARLLAATAACTAATAAVVLVGDLDQRRGLLAAVVLPCWVVFLLVVRGVTRDRRRPLRRPVLAVVLLAAVVQLPGLVAPPRMSSDAYRYVWDGRVQLAGVSPYRFVPLDDRLAALRDPVLFPGLGPRDRSGVTTRPVPTERALLLARDRNDPRTRINRPAVPTVYPPAAEGWFAAVAAVTPWAAGTWGLQLAGALVAVLVAGLLAGWLRRRGRDPLGALWWAWCPTVVLEAGNGAHLDVVVAALVVAAVLVASRVARSRWVPAVTGLLVGLAIAVKLTPAVLLPAFTPLRRAHGGGVRHLLTPVTAAGTLLAAYLPQLLIVGTLVVGYLPGYLLEEGGRNRSAVLRLVLPQVAVPEATVVGLAVIGVWALWSSHADQPAKTAVVLLGTVLLLTTPSYPWYSLPLVALCVMARRLEWLAVAVAGYVAYAGVRLPPTTGLAYLAAAVVVLGAAQRRRRTHAAGLVG